MWNYLKTAAKPILLYGMGNGADKVLAQLEKLNIPIAGVFASDGFVRHQIFHGFEVISYSQAKEKFGDMIVLVCFGSSRPEVMELIKKVASEQELYAPDVPVYGDGIFDRDYYNAHKAELDRVYEMLADDTSKRAFENIIQYKLTGKIEYLFACQTEPKEAYENILRLGKNEAYMDLGAYTGDTVDEFLNYTEGEYDRIVAVEPDKRNFKKLTKNTQTLERCHCINAAVNDEYKLGSFAMRGGRNSSVSENGTELTLDSVDNMALGKISYIKMDVEGQELAAIAGAHSTIKRYRPKMLISAYHRNEDMYAIPLEIMKICPEYKVFLRHYPYIPAWDTNFYFI